MLGTVAHRASLCARSLVGGGSTVWAGLLLAAQARVVGVAVGAKVGLAFVFKGEVSAAGAKKEKSEWGNFASREEKDNVAPLTVRRGRHYHFLWGRQVGAEYLDDFVLVNGYRLKFGVGYSGSGFLERVGVPISGHCPHMCTWLP